MNYQKIWNKLKDHLKIEESDLDKHDVLDLMDRFERADESNESRTNLENNGLFEKSEKTGNYNPKPF
jgi:hypothetical protein